MGYKLRVAVELRRLASLLDPLPPGRRAATRALYENPSGTLMVTVVGETGTALRLVASAYGVAPVVVPLNAPEVQSLVMGLDGWLLLRFASDYRATGQAPPDAVAPAWMAEVRSRELREEKMREMNDTGERWARRPRGAVRRGKVVEVLAVLPGGAVRSVWATPGGWRRVVNGFWRAGAWRIQAQTRAGDGVRRLLSSWTGRPVDPFWHMGEAAPLAGDPAQLSLFSPRFRGSLGNSGAESPPPPHAAGANS